MVELEQLANYLERDRKDLWYTLETYGAIMQKQRDEIKKLKRTIKEKNGEIT